MADTIKVVIRVRPLNQREMSHKIPFQWVVLNNSIQLRDGSPNVINYTFDHVFDKDKSTDDIYGEIAQPLVTSAMSGFHSTIFAYGQTSSGKTHTMTGTESHPGIIPSAVTQMFEIIEQTPERIFLIRVSYIEIYNEKLFDLLATENKELSIKEDFDRHVYVNGAVEEVVHSVHDVMRLMKVGDKKRRVAETKANDRSSRSHAIFRFIIESGERADQEQEAIQVAHFNLVDLAGSECAGENTGDRMKEGCKINLSLLNLGTVILSLSKGSNVINFRGSKLTRILQNSLGGNSKTAIICTVTPASSTQTISTLRFATHAKSIQNKAVVNEVMTDSAMLKRAQKEIQALQGQIAKLMSNDTMQKLQQHEQEKSEMQTQIDKLTHMICVSTLPAPAKSSHPATKLRRMTWCPGKGASLLATPNPRSFKPAFTAMLEENESETSMNISPMTLDNLSDEDVPRNVTTRRGRSSNMLKSMSPTFDPAAADNSFADLIDYNLDLAKMNVVDASSQTDSADADGTDAVHIDPTDNIRDDNERDAQIASMEATIEQQNDNIELLERQLAEANDLREFCILEKKIKKSDPSDTPTKAEQLRALRRSVNDYQSVNSATNKQLADMRDEYVQMKQEMELVSDEMKRVNTNNSRLQAKVELLTSQLRQKESEIFDLQQCLDERDVLIEQTKYVGNSTGMVENPAQIRRLEQKYEVIDADRIREIDRLKSELENHRSSVQDEILRLTDEMEEQKCRLEAEKTDEIDLLNRELQKVNEEMETMRSKLCGQDMLHGSQRSETHVVALALDEDGEDDVAECFMSSDAPANSLTNSSVDKYEVLKDMEKDLRDSEAQIAVLSALLEENRADEDCARGDLEKRLRASKAQIVLLTEALEENRSDEDAVNEEKRSRDSETQITQFTAALKEDRSDEERVREDLEKQLRDSEAQIAQLTAALEENRSDDDVRDGLEKQFRHSEAQIVLLKTALEEKRSSDHGSREDLEKQLKDSEAQIALLTAALEEDRSDEDGVREELEKQLGDSQAQITLLVAELEQNRSVEDGVRENLEKQLRDSEAKIAQLTAALEENRSNEDDEREGLEKQLRHSEAQIALLQRALEEKRSADHGSREDLEKQLKDSEAQIALLTAALEEDRSDEDGASEELEKRLRDSETQIALLTAALEENRSDEERVREDLEKRLRDSQAQIAILIAGLEENTSDEDGVRENLEKQLRDSEAQIALLTAALEENRSDEDNVREGLEKQLRDSEAQITLLTTALEENRSADDGSREDLEKQLKDSEAHIALLTSALEEDRSDEDGVREDLKKQLRYSEAQITLLTTALEENRSADDGSREDLEKQLKDSEAQIALLTAALEEDRSDEDGVREDLKKRLRDSETQIALLTTALEENKSANDGSKEDLEKQLKDSEAQIAVLTAALEDDRSDEGNVREGLEKQLRDSEAQITLLTTALEENRSADDGSREDLEKQLKDSEAQIALLTAALEEDRSDEDGVREDLKKRLRDSETQIALLTTALEENRSADDGSREDLEKQLKDSEAQIAVLTAALEEDRSDEDGVREELEKRLRDSETQIALLTAALEEDRSDKDGVREDLEKRLGDSEAQIALLTAALEKNGSDEDGVMESLEKQLRDSEAQIAQLTAALENRSDEDAVREELEKRLHDSESQIALLTGALADNRSHEDSVSKDLEKGLMDSEEQIAMLPAALEENRLGEDSFREDLVKNLRHSDLLAELDNLKKQCIVKEKIIKDLKNNLDEINEKLKERTDKHGIMIEGKCMLEDQAEIENGLQIANEKHTEFLEGNGDQSIDECDNGDNGIIDKNPDVLNEFNDLIREKDREIEELRITLVRANDKMDPIHDYSWVMANVEEKMKEKQEEIERLHCLCEKLENTYGDDLEKVTTELKQSKEDNGRKNLEISILKDELEAKTKEISWKCNSEDTTSVEFYEFENVKKQLELMNQDVLQLNIRNDDLSVSLAAKNAQLEEIKGNVCRLSQELGFIGNEEGGCQLEQLIDTLKKKDQQLAQLQQRVESLSNDLMLETEIQIENFTRHNDELEVLTTENKSLKDKEAVMFEKLEKYESDFNREREKHLATINHLQIELNKMCGNGKGGIEEDTLRWELEERDENSVSNESRNDLLLAKGSVDNENAELRARCVILKGELEKNSMLNSFNISFEQETDQFDLKNELEDVKEKLANAQRRNEELLESKSDSETKLEEIERICSRIRAELDEKNLRLLNLDVSYDMVENDGHSDEADLRRELDTVREKLAESEEKYMAVKGELEKISSMYNDERIEFSCVVNELQMQKTKLMSELEILRQKVVEADAKLDKQMNEADVKLEELREEVNAKHKQLKEADAKLHQLKEERDATLEKQKEEADTKLQKQREEADAKFQQLKEETDIIYNDKINDLELTYNSNVKDYLIQLEQCRINISALMTEKAAVIEDCNQLKEQKEFALTYKIELDSAKEKIAALTCELEEKGTMMECEQTNAVNIMEQLQSDIHVLEAAKSDLELELSRLKVHLEEQKVIEKELRYNMGTLEAEKNELEVEKNELEVKVAANDMCIDKRFEELKHEGNLLRAEKVQCESKISALNLVLEEGEQAKEQLRSSLKDQESENHSLQDRITEFHSTIEAVTSQLKAAESKKMDLQEELDDRVYELSESTEHVKNLVYENNRLTMNLAKKTSENSALLDQINEMKSELKEKIKSGGEEVDRCKEKQELHDLTEKYAALKEELHRETTQSKCKLYSAEQNLKRITADYENQLKAQQESVDFYKSRHMDMKTELRKLQQDHDKSILWEPPVKPASKPDMRNRMTQTESQPPGTVHLGGRSGVVDSYNVYYLSAENERLKDRIRKLELGQNSDSSVNDKPTDDQVSAASSIVPTAVCHDVSREQLLTATPRYDTRRPPSGKKRAGNLMGSLSRYDLDQYLEQRSKISDKKGERVTESAAAGVGHSGNDTPDVTRRAIGHHEEQEDNDSLNTDEQKGDGRVRQVAWGNSAAANKGKGSIFGIKSVDARIGVGGINQVKKGSRLGNLSTPVEGVQVPVNDKGSGEQSQTYGKSVTQIIEKYEKTPCKNAEEKQSFRGKIIKSSSKTRIGTGTESNKDTRERDNCSVGSVPPVKPVGRQFFKPLDKDYQCENKENDEPSDEEPCGSPLRPMRGGAAFFIKSPKFDAKGKVINIRRQPKICEQSSRELATGHMTPKQTIEKPHLWSNDCNSKTSSINNGALSSGAKNSDSSATGVNKRHKNDSKDAAVSGDFVSPSTETSIDSIQMHSSSKKSGRHAAENSESSKSGPDDVSKATSSDHFSRYLPPIVGKRTIIPGVEQDKKKGTGWYRRHRDPLWDDEETDPNVNPFEEGTVEEILADMHRRGREHREKQKFGRRF